MALKLITITIHIDVMILAITGTPATGKSSVAAKLAEITGWKLVGLNEMAESKSLYSGYDRKRKCKEVDLDAIGKEVARMSSEHVNLIIESHYSQDVPSYLVIVLRANPGELRSRAKEKGWEHEKTEENVVAEIMEECKIDTIMQGRRMVELDTTGKSTEDVAKGIAQLLHDSGMYLLRDVNIPKELRERLREPFGEIFTDIRKAADSMKGTDIIAVGDFVSFSLYSIGIIPGMFVIDGKVRREPFRRKIPLDYEVVKAKNEPGLLTKDLWMATQKALGMKEHAKIVVDGEEDMAALPIILMAREGTSVIYGLHGKGACVVKVSEETRKSARNLLRKIVSQ